MKKYTIIFLLFFFLCIGVLVKVLSNKHQVKEESKILSPTEKKVEPKVEQIVSNVVLEDTIRVPQENLELPLIHSKDQIIRHLAYTIRYSEAYEQAAWVAYELTADETNRLYERSNDFESDPNVSTGSATDRDYKGSGYDRGHLAPAADMSSTANTMQESFYYSNMSPQDPSFNRGIWKKLEELVRDWAVDYKSVYVVTGPVLTDGLPTIGPNHVSVPKYYYKVILDHHEHPKAIAFILPNQGSKESLTRYVVSIDELERITGIDFFPGLVDREENALEKEVCIACWSWTSSSSGSRSHHSSKNVGTSSQCMGTTKKGARCKRMTKDPSGYCYQHD